MNWSVTLGFDNNYICNWLLLWFLYFTCLCSFICKSSFYWLVCYFRSVKDGREGWTNYECGCWRHSHWWYIWWLAHSWSQGILLFFINKICLLMYFSVIVYLCQCTNLYQRVGCLEVICVMKMTSKREGQYVVFQQACFCL